MFVLTGTYVELRLRHTIHIDTPYKSKAKVIFLKYLPLVYSSTYSKTTVWILEPLRKTAGVNTICLCEKKETKHILRGHWRFNSKNSLLWALFCLNLQSLKVNFIHILMHKAVFIDQTSQLSWKWSSWWMTEKEIVHTCPAKKNKMV